MGKNSWTKADYANYWTQERREARSRKMQAMATVTHPNDPDEHTIYHVLCPAIRKNWTRSRTRKSQGKVPVVIQQIKSELFSRRK